MALHLVARSLGRTGLAKLLEQASRPAGIVLLDPASHLGTALSGGQSQIAGNAEASFSGMPALHSANASGFSAFSVTVSPPARTFASAAVEEVITAEDNGESSVEVEPEKSTKGNRDTKRRRARRKANRAKKLENAERTSVKSEDGRPNWGRESLDENISMRRKKRQSEAAKKDLTRRVKDAPPDANLEELLADGKAGHVEIDGKIVQGVLYNLANDGDNVELQHGEDPDKGAAVNEDGTTSSPGDARRFMKLFDWWESKNAGKEKHKCSPEDARRALNLFEWWQKKNADVPQVWLLNPLLKALSRGGLEAELQAIWETYKASAKYDNRLVADTLQAFYFLGKFDEVLAIHKAACDNEWPVVHKANDFAMRAVLARGASADEAWEFYKQMVERTGQGLYDQQGFTGLLKTGVSVEQIRSLEYKEPDALANRLIQALSMTGRRDEAEKIVNEFLEREQPEMSLVRLVTVLSTMVSFDFKVRIELSILVSVLKFPLPGSIECKNLITNDSLGRVCCWLMQ